MTFRVWQVVLFPLLFVVVVSGLVFPRCTLNCSTACGKVMHFVTVTVLIISGVIGCVDSKVFPRTCSKGTISPREPFFVDGQNITLVCDSKNRTLRWKHLMFVRGPDAEVVPQRYVVKINGTAIKLQIPVTEAEIRNHTTSMQYRCVYKRKKKHLCMDNVYVQLDCNSNNTANKARTPIDIDCKLYDFSSINCTWKLGVDYVHDVDVKCLYDVVWYDLGNATVVYKSDNPRASWQECPQQKGNSCIWKGNNFTDPLKLLIKVTVKNSRADMPPVSLEHTFNKYDITEPGPMENLSVDETEEPRCFMLKWSPSSAGSSKDFTYNVTYQSDCSEPKSKRVYYNSSTKICYLNPFTNYTFGVSGRILAPKSFDNTTHIGKGHWSRITTTSFKTSVDVIDENPLVHPGLYEFDSDKSKEKDGYSVVRIYWKPLSKCEQHSKENTLNYYVTAYNITSISRYDALFEQIIIPRGIPINVTIHVNNSIGGPDSAVGTAVYPVYMAPKPSELIVLYNDTNSKCSIFASVVPKDAEPVSHTVVWCKGSINCQEPIQWQALNFNETVYQFPPDVCAENTYRFGLITYSMGDERISSGIRWNKCIYQIDKVPTEPLPDVRFIPGEKLTIQWSEYDCHQINAYVTGYNVSYCRTDREDCICDGKIITKVVPKNYTRFVDDSLPGESTVCFWVTPITKVGLGRPSDRQRCVISPENRPVTWMVIGVCGGLFVLLAGAVVGIRRWRRSLKDNNRVELPLHVTDNQSWRPAVPNHSGEETRERLLHDCNRTSGDTSGISTEISGVYNDIYEKKESDDICFLTPGSKGMEGYHQLISSSSANSNNVDEYEDDVASGSNEDIVSDTSSHVEDQHDQNENEEHSVMEDIQVNALEDIVLDEGNTSEVSTAEVHSADEDVDEGSLGEETVDEGHGDNDMAEEKNFLDNKDDCLETRSEGSDHETIDQNTSSAICSSGLNGSYQSPDRVCFGYKHASAIDSSESSFLKSSDSIPDTDSEKSVKSVSSSSPETNTSSDITDYTTLKCVSNSENLKDIKDLNGIKNGFALPNGSARRNDKICHIQKLPSSALAT